MTQKVKVRIGLLMVALLAVVAVAVVSTNSTLFQGKMIFKNTKSTATVAPVVGSKAVTLVDSALQDTDFDGVLYPIDKCPDVPAYQIVRFNTNDFTQYLGQTIKLKEVYNDGSMTFDAGGRAHGVLIGKNTYVTPNQKAYPGFTIRGLFSSYSPTTLDHEAIVVISRTDYNISTGCSK